MIGCDDSEETVARVGEERGQSADFEIWSSPRDSIAHPGYSLALNEATGGYLYFLKTDIPSEPQENFPKRGSFHRGKGEVIPSTLFGSEVRLRELELEGTPALIVEGYEIEDAIRTGRVLLKRSFVDIENPWATTGDTAFERARKVPR